MTKICQQCNDSTNVKKVEVLIRWSVKDAKVYDCVESWHLCQSCRNRAYHLLKDYFGEPKSGKEKIVEEWV